MHLQRKGHVKSAYHQPCATLTKKVKYLKDEGLTASSRVNLQKYQDDDGVLHLAPEPGVCPRCRAQLDDKTLVTCPTIYRF